jgi:hypothetical protein
MTSRDLGPAQRSLVPIKDSTSGYGALMEPSGQPVATGRKWDGADNRSIKRIRNRWQPTATVPKRMVRRGSTVRVRQRALQKRCTSALFRFFVQLDLRSVERAAGVEAIMQLSRSRAAPAREDASGPETKRLSGGTRMAVRCPLSTPSMGQGAAARAPSRLSQHSDLSGTSNSTPSACDGAKSRREGRSGRVGTRLVHRTSRVEKRR